MGLLSRERTQFTPSASAEDMLSELREFFKSAPQEERAALWDVLVALRGPDRRRDKPFKQATTAVIRKRVLGDAVLRNVEIADDLPTHLQQRSRMPGGHFYEHAVKAFRALGLRW